MHISELVLFVVYVYYIVLLTTMLRIFVLIITPVYDQSYLVNGCERIYLINDIVH